MSSGSDYESDSGASTVLLDSNTFSDDELSTSPPETEEDEDYEQPIDSDSERVPAPTLPVTRRRAMAGEAPHIVPVEEPMMVDDHRVLPTAMVTLVDIRHASTSRGLEMAARMSSPIVTAEPRPSPGDHVYASTPTGNLQPSTSGQQALQPRPPSIAPVPPAPTVAPSFNDTDTPSCSSRGAKSRRLNDSQDSEEEGLTCTICMEMWNNSGPHRLVALKCGHLYGQSCIERWLHGQGQRCPQCNRKSRKSELRIIYAKNLKVGDTSELERVKQALEKEMEKSRGYEFVIAEGNLKIQHLRSEMTKLKDLVKQNDNRKQLNSPIKSSHGGYHDTTPRQWKFVHEKTVDIIREGSCRVLATTEFLNMIVVSQPNTISALFPGYGLKKLNTLDFHASEFIPIHHREIRDVSFNPSRMDGLVLTASMDKTLKLTSVISNSIVQVFNANVEVWSCVWNLDNDSQFFAGVKNGSVLLFDIRQPATPVKEVLPIHHGYPVTSLQYVPMKPLESFSCGGLIVGQLGRCSFLESTTNNDYRFHILPIEGAVTSVSFESTHRHFMASCRPTNRQPLTSHTVCELTEFTDDTLGHRVCSSNEVRKFSGGGTQGMITKSRLIAHPTLDGHTMACASNESTASTVIWDVASGKQLQNLPAQAPVLDICPVKGSGHNFLAALTERAVKVYKWQAD